MYSLEDVIKKEGGIVRGEGGLCPGGGVCPGGGFRSGGGGIVRGVECPDTKRARDIIIII